MAAVRVEAEKCAYLLDRSIPARPPEVRTAAFGADRLPLALLPFSQFVAGMLIYEVTLGLALALGLGLHALWVARRRVQA